VIQQKPKLVENIEEARILYEEQLFDIDGLKNAQPQALKDHGIPYGLHMQIVKLIKPFLKYRSTLRSSPSYPSSQ
jgi:hypothetical protein